MRARTRLTLLLLIPAALWAILAERPRPAVIRPEPDPKTLPAAAFIRLGTPDLQFDRGAVFPDGSRFVLVSERAMHVVDARTRACSRRGP